MKQKRMGRTIVSLMIALVMCFGLMSGAYAEGEINGTEDAPAQAAITKRVDMPLAVNTPAASFTFTVEKKSFNNGTTTDDLARMPAITNKTITFAPTDTTDIITTDTIKSIAKQVNVFDGVTFATAGIYTYTIKETANTYTVQEDEEMTYSTGEYELTAYVANKSTTGTYIKIIIDKVMAVDNAGQAVGDKVDPTPTTQITGTATAMVFTNTFLKAEPLGDEDPDDPETYATKISKTVTGDFADKTKPFTFSVNVTKPALTAADATTFTGYVYDVDGAKGEAIEFTYGTAQEVELSHGEQLVLVDAYIGSTYSVSETAETGYTASIAAMSNGVETQIDAAATGTLTIAEEENGVAYTNDCADITPTGIIMDNMAFIIMIVVACGVLASSVVFKSYKRKASGNNN